MRTPQEPGVATVVAAREGDQRALDELVAGYLPLVYNVVGHALSGHADTDDVVQETMLRAVHGLSGLRDPASFRSWLVVIAMNQVRDRHREHLHAPVGDDALADLADPGADFVDLTIVRLQLSGQRREVVEATRWIGEDERELLSLWWLEAAGRLTRAEVAEAVGLSPQHTAVRVQRMKAQLDAARTVVRVLRHTPRCPGLDDVVSDWDGHPSALWRKRIVRHSRECARCERAFTDLAAVEGLVARLPLVPVPLGLEVLPLPADPATLTGIAAQGTAVRGTTHGQLTGFAKFWASSAAKPIAAAAAAAVVAGVVVVVPLVRQDDVATAAAPLTTASIPSAPPASSQPVSTSPSATSSSSPAPASTTTPVPATTQAPVVAAPPVRPVARSAKKGVSTWHFDGVTRAIGDVGAGWYYNWATNRENVAAPDGTEYVPMIWGAKTVTRANLDTARREGTTLLGFNEPDLAEQSNMSVEQALELWPQLQATGMRLGSPAVAHGADTPGGWLDRFLSGAKARGSRVDFITLHWYGSDFSAAAVGHLKNYLEAVHARYGLPIWVTEYSLMDFSGGSVRYPTQSELAAFARDSSAMMEGLSYVERYAWFALPADKPGTGLYLPGGTPNAVGEAYRSTTS
ncbi:sigma-70 family RNA polymerase sigma factor [Umezawaea beigongshangensis]|uniref:sigma-70 family RNA polymerase sigma factor n=1 Tax=Umezawaea beigongshangensis TaxID=2780383 RepID=UPI0018F1E7B1|nr:sigma-70 family RNA polymerase sigma factor [Umezawaea beigongshangensis]